MLGSDGSEDAFETCGHPCWGPGTPGDAEERVSGGALPAVLFPGAGVPEREEGSAPALRTVACTGTSRPRRRSAGGIQRRETLWPWPPREGPGPALLQPSAPKSLRPHSGRGAAGAR